MAEMICRGGDEPGTKSAALVVLIAPLEDSNHPKALAKAAKHIAFTRCGELNLNGKFDAQIEFLSATCSRVEREQGLVAAVLRY